MSPPPTKFVLFCWTSSKPFSRLSLIQMEVLISKKNFFTHNSNLPPILVLAARILPAHCKGLDHDLDTPKRETLCTKSCTTTKKRAVNNATRISAAITDAEMACASLRISFSILPRAEGIASRRPSWPPQKEITGETIQALMTGSLSTWSDIDFNILPLWCPMKYKISVVIAEQEEVSVDEQRCVYDRTQRTPIKWHILLKLLTWMRGGPYTYW